MPPGTTARFATAARRPLGARLRGHDQHPAAAEATEDLRVSSPADQGEREAERIAEDVVGPTGPPVPPSLHVASAPAGQPLDPATRAFFEPRFGHDFSGVRVHHGAAAAAATSKLHARAFTLDRDVVFGAGEYRPGDASGRRLLAHELAHVVQQRGRSSGAPAQLQRQAATGTKKEEEAPQFTYSAGLNPELKARFNRMVLGLKAKGVTYGTINDVRPRTNAHILSTAYHIREKQAIPIGQLQALKEGKDLDGNVWFKDEWKQVPGFLGLGKPRSATDEEQLAKAKENAVALVKALGSSFLTKGNINCAYEGYEPADPHRKPNVPDVPVSNHVSGNAIDLSAIDWDKLGGSWSEDARKFVASYGLTRPYSPEATTYCIKEHWHFELAR
jgi:hypothetical protein